ncbi:hypothetical protein ACFX1X_020727 [Malus domestica]
MSLREKIEAEASFKISKKYPFIFAAHSGGNDAMRKPRILLAATGSVVVLKFVNLCQIFSRWVEVKAVATRVSLCFIDQASLPKDVSDLYQAVLDIWPEIEQQHQHHQQKPTQEDNPIRIYYQKARCQHNITIMANLQIQGCTCMTAQRQKERVKKQKENQKEKQKAWLPINAQQPKLQVD